MRNQYEYYSPFEVHIIMGRLTPNIPSRNRYENYSLESTTDDDKTHD